MKRREAIQYGTAALLSTSFLSILQSCRKQSSLSWTPVFLNADQAQVISSIVDTLLPKTDTPGGLDVKVDVFLDGVYAKMYTAEAQQKVVSDIQAFNKNCQETYGDYFQHLSADKKLACLQAVEKAAPKFGGQVWGTAVGPSQPVGFYRSLKSMAIWAYCTTEAIGKNVLNYDPLPGEYQGCIPLTDIGKVWSL